MDDSLRSRLISLIDLTNLNADCTDNDVIALSKKAITPFAPVAAVCVYPKFIDIARTAIAPNHQSIAICTVVNFPTGTDTIKTISSAIKTSLQKGANEIDIVLPYQEYLAGNTSSALTIIEQYRSLIPKNNLLKVILETGAFTDAKKLYALSRELIELNVDFLKTSTGKIPIGATIEAATILLRAIKDSGKNIGFKASGGIRTVEQALCYYNLAKDFFSENWLTPKNFRLGASSLLDHLLV